MASFEDLSDDNLQRMREFLEGDDGHLSDHDFYELMMDLTDANEDMPYGTQKARDGDPYEWLHDKISELYWDELFPVKEYT